MERITGLVSFADRLWQTDFTYLKALNWETLISLVVRWMRLGDALSSITGMGAPMAHARFLLHAFSLWPEKASQTLGVSLPVR